MIFFRKSLFKGVPGPSPWYLSADPPKTAAAFSWSDAGESTPFAGKTVLAGPDGPLAIFDFNNYVSALSDSRLLVWHQSPIQSGPTPPVRLLLLSLSALRPLVGDLYELCASMGTRKTRLLINGEPAEQVDLDTTVAGTDQSMMFPETLRKLKELLILCRSSGIDPNPTGDNLALLIAHPYRATYRLYAQDWFNSGGLDYDYQWVTRVVRHPLTGRIHGEGIRIAPFVLDDTLQRCR